MSSSERQQARSPAVLASLVLLLSLGLASLGAYWYEPPNLIGFSGGSPFADPDLWCVLGSCACALVAGVVSFRYSFASHRPARGAIVGGVVGGAGLALLLFLLWGPFVLFYALLLAPPQAFAFVCVWSSWRRHRRDAAFQRLGFGNSGQR
jgi:hypothetical protein